MILNILIIYLKDKRVCVCVCVSVIFIFCCSVLVENISLHFQKFILP